MNILQRVLAGFGIVIAVGAIQSATTVWQVRDLSQKIDVATTVPLTQVDATWRASKSFRRADDFVRQILDGINDQPATAALAEFNTLMASVDGDLVSARLSGPGASQQGRQVDSDIRQWRADALVLLGDSNTAAIPAPHIMERRSSAIRDALLRLITDAQHNAAEARDNIIALAARTQALAIIYALSGIGGGGLVAVLFALSLTRPLLRLQARVGGIIMNDLDAPIHDTNRRDEIGSIARALMVLRDRRAEQLTELAAKEAEQLARAEEDRQKRANEVSAAQQSAVVEAVSTALERLADGDLTYRLEQSFPPTYEPLRNYFNAAVTQLEDSMAGITDTVGALRSSTDEIAKSADELSRRTEQNAASLEQTAAALGEITSTVRKTAEGAKQVNIGVSQTKADAELSGQVVRQAVAAMGAIERSSQEIGQIIGVIDEIAFQTNLLALNAGVEAARAGDSGKGFAVVASEVRALAQRSADAARQIKSLIANSSKEVDAGVKLVDETGSTLARIEHQVREISGVVSEIAAAAAAEASGLAEVNATIAQMDRVTQQNAAMVETSTAANHALAAETAELAKTTERFQLRRHGARRAPS